MASLDDSFSRRGNDEDDFVETPIFRKNVDQSQQQCPSCSKNLSHLDSLRRSHHINKCLDKDEVKSNVVRIQDNYDKTRDCPLCFEPLTPGPHRVTHYKRCAKAHNVTAAEMNDMIAHNDKVAEIRKRSGIKHTRADQKSSTQLEGNLSAKMAKKNKIGPKNLADEHMETALALSLSENILHFDSQQQEISKMKQSNLKQITLPTLLESTSSEMRFNVLQERLFQVVLNDSSAKKRKMDECEDQEAKWKYSRWWRIQADEGSKPDEYKIESFKNRKSARFLDEMEPAAEMKSVHEENAAIVDLEMTEEKFVSLKEKPDLELDAIEQPRGDPDPNSGGTSNRVDDSVIILDDDDDHVHPVQMVKSHELEVDSFFNNLPLDLSHRLSPAEVDQEMIQPEKMFSTPSTSNTMVTPSTLSNSMQKKLWQRGIYVLKRKNVTPTPDFKSMTTPLIKANLKKHGFRICARRKAIKLLTRTYNATHPYLTEKGEIEEPVYAETPRGVKKTTGKTNNLAKKFTNCKRRKGTDPDKSKSVENVGKATSSKSVLEDKVKEKDTLNESIDSEIDSSFEKGDNDGVLEESLLPSDGDLDVMDLDQGTQTATADLPSRLLECFRNQDELYKRILRYEPLPFKLLQQTVRDGGIRCSAAKLLDFLDSQCITFTLKKEENKQSGKHVSWKPRASRKTSK